MVRSELTQRTARSTPAARKTRGGEARRAKDSVHSPAEMVDAEPRHSAVRAASSEQAAEVHQGADAVAALHLRLLRLRSSELGTLRRSSGKIAPMQERQSGLRPKDVSSKMIERGMSHMRQRRNHATQRHERARHTPDVDVVPSIAEAEVPAVIGRHSIPEPHGNVGKGRVLQDRDLDELARTGRSKRPAAACVIRKRPGASGRMIDFDTRHAALRAAALASPQSSEKGTVQKHSGQIDPTQAGASSARAKDVSTQMIERGLNQCVQRQHHGIQKHKRARPDPSAVIAPSMAKAKRPAAVERQQSPRLRGNDRERSMPQGRSSEEAARKGRSKRRAAERVIHKRPAASGRAINFEARHAALRTAALESQAGPSSFQRTCPRCSAVCRFSGLAKVYRCVARCGQQLTHDSWLRLGD